MLKTLMDWLGTFWKVLTLPTAETFRQEAKKAEGKFTSALGWLVFYAVYLYILASLSIVHGLLSVPTLIAALLVLPLTVILFTSTAYYLCKRISRQKETLYDQMFYLFVTILLPVFFVMPLLVILFSRDIFELLGFVLLFYQVALLTIATKALAGIEYWQALVVVFFSLVAAILAGIIALITIYATIASPESINRTNNINTTPIK